jgi:hypothetical protein
LGAAICLSCGAAIFAGKSEKPAGLVRRGYRIFRKAWSLGYSVVRIFQIICPQAHIGIRMDIHMTWIEETIAIGSLFKINPSVKTEVQTALA